MIISLCEYSGEMLKPWADAGHECHAYDIQHSIRRDKQRDGIWYHWADVRSLTPEDFFAKPSMIFAFPPCTNLAVSGARDFQRKGLQGLIDGLQLVEACRKLCAWFECPWMLENPVSRLSSCWRKPDATFHPWQFGDAYSKKTCIWFGNGFVFPSPRVSHPPADCDQRIWTASPGPGRANFRSKTPEGFARAVYDANAHHAKVAA